MFHHAHQSLAAIADIFARAPEALRSQAEAAAGRPFPLEIVAKTAEKPRYESLEAADRQVRSFLVDAGDDRIRAIEDATGADLDRHLDNIDTMKPFRKNILPKYRVSETGGVEAIPHFSRETAEYHSLGNATYMKGVDVSVFARPIAATQTYEGAAALEAFMHDRPWPAPTGVMADYRVEILDGEILTHPVHPGDLLRAQRDNDDRSEEMEP